MKNLFAIGEQHLGEMTTQLTQQQLNKAVDSFKSLQENCKACHQQHRNNR
jgi:cytochrome c556